MNLPNYFLADLPAEASLSATMIAEACQTLRRNRERYLRDRSTQGLLNVIQETAERWLDPQYPLRQMALEEGPAATGFSEQVLAEGLDAFFGELTVEKLRSLIAQELGHPDRLDTLVAAEPELKAGQAAMVTGPGLLVHITAGNLPVPTLMSILLGLLVRSAQFVKCATGASFIPRLFAHSLHETDPKLASCLELAEWKGGRTDLEGVLFESADCVTATGSDETLQALRGRMPSRVRFVGYGHRVSFAFVSAKVLTDYGARRVARQAAVDVSAWDQLGCLSPHLIYVEEGGKTLAEDFAELLAQALEERQAQCPRGWVSKAEAAAIAHRRAFYQLRAAQSPDTRLWQSSDSTAWTVVYEADPRFQMSCLHRFVYVKRVASLEEALQQADPVRRQVSTVGLAVPEYEAEEYALKLARWGVTRVCPVGRMQKPSLLWRHDGRPSLGELVTWTTWEQ